MPEVLYSNASNHGTGNSLLEDGRRWILNVECWAFFALKGCLHWPTRDNRESLIFMPRNQSRFYSNETALLKSAVISITDPPGGLNGNFITHFLWQKTILNDECWIKHFGNVECQNDPFYYYMGPADGTPLKYATIVPVGCPFWYSGTFWWFTKSIPHTYTCFRLSWHSASCFLICRDVTGIGQSWSRAIDFKEKFSLRDKIHVIYFCPERSCWKVKDKIPWI